jgi:hypothetical protein
MPSLFLQLVFVGLLFSSHHLIPLLKTKGDYTPFSVEANVSQGTFDEAHAYAPLPQRVFRGENISGDLDVYELAKQNTVYPKLCPLIVGYLARWVGSVELAWIICQAVFPMLIWLVIYLLLGTFAVSPLWQSLGAWVSTTFPFAPRNSLLLGWQSLLQPLELSRMLHPCMSYLFFLLVASAAAWTLVLQRVAVTVSVGFLSSLLFHTYYFYWMPFYSAMGVLIICGLLSRKLLFAKHAFLFAASGALGGLPTILASREAMEGNRAMLERLGFYTRDVNLTGVAMVIVTIAIITFFARRSRDLRFPEVFSWVTVALIGGVGFGLNAQLLTGYDGLHEVHYIRRVINPVLVFLFFLCATKYAVPHLKRSGARAFCVLSLFLVVGAAAFRQYHTGSHSAEFHRKSSSRMQTLLWARDHLPVRSVIGTSDAELIMLIPSITGSWTFVPSLYRTSANDQEILSRYLLLGKLEGRDNVSLVTELEKAPASSLHPWSSTAYVLLGRPITAPMVSEVLAELGKKDMTSHFSNRRLDYLILPKNFDPASLRQVFSTSTRVYSNQDWEILKMGPEAARLTRVMASDIPVMASEAKPSR